MSNFRGFTQKPSGWRSETDGDPSQRGLTASARNRVRVFVGSQPVATSVPPRPPTRGRTHGGRGGGSMPLPAGVSITARQMHRGSPSHIDEDIGSGFDGMSDVDEHSWDSEMFDHEIENYHSGSASYGGRQGSVRRTAPIPAVPVNFRPLRAPSGRFVSGNEEESSTSSGKRRRRSASIPDWLITSAMPGGPIDPSIIPSYGGHIAAVIWGGGERCPPVIECLSRKLSLRKLLDTKSHMSSDALDALNESPLVALPVLMFEHVDHTLIAAFVERWQPDTNTFHMPFGEITIMLHDVENILGIAVNKVLPICPSIEEIGNVVEEMFGKSVAVLRSDGTYSRGGILDSAIQKICVYPDISAQDQVRAWHLSLLGSTILVDKSRDKVRPHPIISCDDVDKFAWGAVALAYLYRHLGAASRSGTSQIGGCMTLLQAWIYEYFPAFRPHLAAPFVDGEPRASTWHVRNEKKSVNRLVDIRRTLDGMAAEQVIWCPYGNKPAETCPRTTYMGCIRAFDVVELYAPDRTVRQLGYVQPIPGPADPPLEAIRPSDGNYEVKFNDKLVTTTWDTRFPRGCTISLNNYQRSTYPSETERGYLAWWSGVSHPRLIASDMPVVPFIEDPSTYEYWAHEWPKRVMPILNVDPDQPLPQDLFNSITDLCQTWCKAMHIQPRVDDGDN